MVTKEDMVGLLRKSVAEFNEVRRKDPELQKSLVLRDADLKGLNLAKVDLSRADLTGADLWGSDLTGASLNNAILKKANLGEANLSGVNFHRSTLEGATLAGARVEEFAGDCRLCLHKTNFQGTRWGKEQIEAMLKVINENSDWLIQYRIIAK